MKEIKKIAVIGSGVMGAGIAAHIANANHEVLLLDIVPEGASDKSMLAKKAIEKMLSANPAPLTHKSKAKYITAGNLEDDISKLRDVDWIIEVVLEDVKIKQNLYRKINGFRKEGAIVSSNTSTIPLASLLDGMSKEFQRDFMITHFFNPPRYMRLLELVQGEHTRAAHVELIHEFCDKKLGKGIVRCKDTPGFIANRVGCYWMTVGLQTAISQGVSVEVADAVMSKPIGVPKTGVFGLMDLIGIDLLPLIAKEMLHSLPKEDAFCRAYNLPAVVKEMIEQGYTGRKGKGGFYMLEEKDGKKQKLSKNLQSGAYEPSEKPALDSVNAARGGLRALVEHPDEGGKYARAVLFDTLHYAASLVPEIADSVHDVDEAMRLGYNWKYGPFELIDRLGGDDMAGPAWFAQALKAEGKTVPPLLLQVANAPFYKDEPDAYHVFNITSNQHEALEVPGDAWTLEEKTRGKKPIKKNGSASLWDVGDGVVCLEFRSKMNSLDPTILDMLTDAVEIVKKDHRALIIGNDSDNFSVGANIGVLLFAANIAGWKMIEGIIKQGQDTMMALKYAPFPVVGAPTGMALGGGCEMLLHCDGVQAHIETYTGLVEVGVGFVPGWGGCKEMVYRQLQKQVKEQTAVQKMGGMFSFISPIKALSLMPAVAGAFEMISTARVSKSAEEAKRMLILPPQQHGITMNRRRLLADAKALALKLAKNYQPPQTYAISLPGKTGRKALEMALTSFVKSGKATPHDEVVCKKLAYVLTGGDASVRDEITEQGLLDIERAAFMELVRHPDTIARIEHMLETGKPLRN